MPSDTALDNNKQIAATMLPVATNTARLIADAVLSAIFKFLIYNSPLSWYPVEQEEDSTPPPLRD